MIEIAAIAVAVLALLVSGLSVIYTRRQAHSAEDTARIERERRAEEVADRQARASTANSARVWARALPPESNSKPRWRVGNDGPSVAHNVRVRRLEVIEGVDAVRFDPYYELGDIAPDQPAEKPFVRLGTSAIRIRVQVTWTDGNGEQASEEILHVPARGSARQARVVVMPD